MSVLISEADVRVSLGIAAIITDEERQVLSTVVVEATKAIADFLGYDPVQRSVTEFYPRGNLASSRRGSEEFDSNGTRAYIRSTSGRRQTLQLARLPVRSVASVRVDLTGRFGQASGAFPGSTELVSGVDYWAEFEEANLCQSGMLISTGLWPTEPGSVRVTYVAGYSSQELAGRAYTTETVGGDVTEYTNAGVNASAIVRAAKLTASKFFQTEMSNRKSSATGWRAAGSLTGEKLGDYAYTKDAMASRSLTGMAISLPGEAAELLEPYVHYGLART
jgi:hypothetical protein